LGVLQTGAVLAVKAAVVPSAPANEVAAYHAALVSLAGEDLGPCASSWRRALAEDRRRAGAPTR
jgi:hypothetical protein